eukprot:scaffold36374_cov58-Attheya_sp.AAC.8
MPPKNGNKWHVRADFLGCLPGDAIRITGGKHVGHLAMFTAVEKVYIEVRVRIHPGVIRPIDDYPAHIQYFTTYLPPAHLVIDPMLNSDKSIDAAKLAELRRQIDIIPPVPIYLGRWPAVQRAADSIRDTLSDVMLLSMDLDLVEYTLALVAIVKIDLEKITMGAPTIIQTLIGTTAVRRSRYYDAPESAQTNFDEPA